MSRVTVDEGAGVRLLNNTSVTVTGVTFVASRQSYVVSGQLYQKFLADVVKQVTDDLLTDAKKNSPPPSLIDLSISSSLGTNAVAGDLHITIRFEEM